MKRRGNVTTYSGDDIAAAFNRPLPSTPCVNCPHQRHQHRRVVVKPGLFDGIEEHFECEHFDNRTKSGLCKCTQFTPSTPEGES